MGQLHDPLQPLHQLLKGSGEAGLRARGCPAHGPGVRHHVRAHRLPHGATHVAQVQELGFVGGAQEGRADHQVDLCAGVSLLPPPRGPCPASGKAVSQSRGVGRRLTSLPGTGPTCRVGSREARWASCSLNAFSFSSCWLQQSRRRAPALGELPGPGHPRKEAPTRAPMGASSSHHAGLGRPVPAGAPRPPNVQRCSRGPSPLHGFQERLLSLGELLLQTARMPHVPWLRRTSALCQGVGGHPWVQGGVRCPTGPPTCMPLKRALMAVSSWLALLRTSSIMALRRTMASRVDVCSSFTACPGWRGGCGAAAASMPRPRAPRAHLPAPPGPASRSPARTPSRCRCSAPGSPCGGGREGTAGVGDAGTGGRGDTHPCMSLKQLMQSMDFFSVENMM